MINPYVDGSNLNKDMKEELPISPKGLIAKVCLDYRFVKINAAYIDKVALYIGKIRIAEYFLDSLGSRGVVSYKVIPLIGANRADLDIKYANSEERCKAICIEIANKFADDLVNP